MSSNNNPLLAFTGEYYIPGATEERIEADHTARYRFAAQFVNDNNVLDAACGTGFGSEFIMAGNAKSYTGIDINENLISHARQTYGGLVQTFEVSDVTSLKCSHPFDAIISFETIEHVDNYQAMLSGFREVISPEGILIISSPNRPVTSPFSKSIDSEPSNRFHVREFTVKELVLALHENGFDVAAEDIFGQRLRRRWMVPGHPMYKLCHRIFPNPDQRSSPLVRPLDGQVPRYFVLLARPRCR